MANPNSTRLLLRTLLIVSAGFWVFAPALHGDWLMDDDLYLTQNVLLNDPARVWKIWFAPGSLIEYYPIEASVQAIQWGLWHNETLGYHLTNLLLHITGALLVWRLLGKFGLRLAWLGGLLFAVHPAVVESVAWISELKNTLSLPPFLLAACAWIDYETHGKRRDYVLALGLFLLAMLCKISMALFPLVLLLYAWWKRGRIGWSDARAAAPFFAISLVLGIITIWAGTWFRVSHLQSAASQQIGGVAARVALAGWSIAFYFTKAVFPVNMLPIYPKWPISPPSLTQFLPWPVLGLALFWFWTQRATWGRHALLGVGFFLINLAPFIGLDAASYMGFTWVMDHFLYLPLIGVIGLAVAALENLEDRLALAARPAWAMGIAAVLALLALESHDYAAIFAGPEQLWGYTAEHNPTSWLAHNNLGNVLFETDRRPQAIAEYQRSLQLNPEGVEAHNNLGLALDQLGRTAEAIHNYELALKFSPNFPVALVNLGNALSEEGRRQEAIATYKQALLVNSRDASTRARLAELEAASKPK